MDLGTPLTTAQGQMNAVLAAQATTDAAPATPPPALNIGSHILGDVTIEYQTTHVGQ
ncbi:hypothetical protein ABQJ54_03370 [Rhodanobacter sp. Si-c]|uniref:Uncharacterized protein n=1 Tax=Rhodanobacter lycopersici TaxID=3162487 RepID=A0ABV3QAH0_9GAMM